jgi:hypothetical protein
MCTLKNPQAMPDFHGVTGRVRFDPFREDPERSRGMVIEPALRRRGTQVMIGAS